MKFFTGKIAVLSAVACLSMTASVFADPKFLSVTDFESGLGGWRARGTVQEITYPRAIVELCAENPKSGKQCLVIRDEVKDGSPYANYPYGEIKPGMKYSLKGWVRSDVERDPADCFIGAIQIKDVNGEKVFSGVKFIDINKISKEWTQFSGILEFDQGIEAVEIMIRPTIWGQNNDIAQVWVDDVEFGPLGELTYEKIDIKPACNRAFKDDVAGDLQGGWTDQGNNDLRNIKTGSLQVDEIDFDIIDPNENNHKSVIALRSIDQDMFAKSAEIKVDKSFKYLYILHTAAWLSPNKPSGTIDLKYLDGTECSLEVIGGKDLGDWWVGNADRAVFIKLDNANPVKSPVFLYAAVFENPSPEKKVSAITLKASADTENKTTWMVLGLAIGSGRTGLDVGKSGALFRDYSQWFHFIPKTTMSANALVNLSTLLDAPAGKHGWLTTKDGHFYFEDGTRARFWGENIHSGNGLFPTHEQAEQLADTFARYGINIVRLHLMEQVLMEFVSDDLPSRFIVDEEKLDRFDYLVKCLKDKGIYIFLGNITGLHNRKWGARFSKADGIMNYQKWDKFWNLFSPRLKELAKEYMQTLLTRKNKYTGLALIDDPAAPICLLINEQTMLDQVNLNAVEDDYYNAMLTTMYNQYLKKKYSSLESLKTAWTSVDGESALLDGEDFDQNSIALTAFSKLNGKGEGWASVNAPVRIKETIQFFKSVQSEYFNEMKAYLVKLGYKGLVATSNLIGDIGALDAFNECDFTCQNVYYDHIKSLPDGKVLFVNDPSVEVNVMNGNVMMIEQNIAGVKINTLPVVSTESAMMNGHEWRSTYYLSYSSTAALQDWDMLFHYSYGGGAGQDWDYMLDRQAMFRYGCNSYNDPSTIAMLPSASLIFLRNDVSPSKNVVQILYTDEDKTLNDGYLYKGTFPYNYLTYVCRVENVFDTPDGRANFILGKNSADMKFSRYELDRTASELTFLLDDKLKEKGLVSQDCGYKDGSLVSDTGEITRAYKKGLLLVDTPRTQGFSGFPAEPIRLTDVEFNCTTKFATIVISSLDNLPLASSRKMLLSAVGRSENSKDIRQYKMLSKSPNGMDRGEMLMITPTLASPTGDLNGNMILVEPIYADISMRGERMKITPLDGGMAKLQEPVTINGSDGKVAFKIGDYKTVWFLLEREDAL